MVKEKGHLHEIYYLQHVNPAEDLRIDASVTYPKSPKSKYNDDEVHSICEEHQHIHISHCTVVWMNKIVEKLSDGHIHLKSPKKT